MCLPVLSKNARVTFPARRMLSELEQVTLALASRSKAYPTGMMNAIGSNGGKAFVHVALVHCKKNLEKESSGQGKGATLTFQPITYSPRTHGMTGPASD